MQTTIQGAIVVIFGILLAPSIGISGVLIGSILSHFYRDIELAFFIPRNVTKISVSKSVLRIVRIFASISIIWIPFLFVDVSPGGYFSWVKTAIGIALFSTFVVVVINLLFEKENTINASKRIVRMVKS